MKTQTARKLGLIFARIAVGAAILSISLSLYTMWVGQGTRYELLIIAAMLALIWLNLRNQNRSFIGLWRKGDVEDG